MIDFLAVLNYEHLDNGFFLTTLAKALKKREKRGLILHEDSEYTERIIQTGVMREEAIIRCYKDLNHRLVALFADEGISTIGLNGYQKNLIKMNGDTLEINFNTLKNLPKEPMILLSSIGLRNMSEKPIQMPISTVASSLSKEFNVPMIDLFSIKENSEFIKEDLPKTVTPNSTDKEFRNKHIPNSFKSFDNEVRVNSPNSF
tara:strand:+ start:9314 stop:9919 length:606 start_codon:yes stop_codon:yes gene_type:complete